MTANIKELSGQYLLQNYKRQNLEIASGSGSIAKSPEGKEYIDFGSGIAVNLFGYSDPAWLAAVKAQLDSVAHVSNYYHSAPQTLLARRLCERSGMKSVFFCNSGAEANEAAIKAARKYSFDKYGKDRSHIITITNSFHGRTITTLSATGQDALHNYFFPFTEGFSHVPINDIGAMKNAITGATCAIMLECIQGESGVTVCEQTYLKDIAEICAAQDILLIVDEIQSGLGRTGKLFSYEHYGIAPDIVTSAKALGGGLPIGAAMFGEKTKSTLTPGTHGSTFGGNPVCAAGALSVLNRIDDSLLASVEAKGKRIMTALKGFGGVEETSGRGLMIGAKTKKEPAAVCTECLENGLLILTAKEKIRLLPALNIPDSLIDKGLEILASVLK